MHTRLPSPTFNDMSWASQLDEAIQCNDVAHMWQLVQIHADPDEGNRNLVARIPRMTHQIKRRTYFNELFLMPVIVWGESDAFDSTSSWRQAYACVDEAILSWFAPPTYTMIFHGLRAYDHLGSWQPAVIRQHLKRAVAAEAVDKLRYSVEHINLPPVAPRLGFVTMVLTSKLGWPVLPQARPALEHRLRQVIAFALHNTPDLQTPAPIVMPPGRVKDAVSLGLVLWLEQLHQVCPILGWSASPHKSSTDVVVITLRLDSDPPWTQFTVRNHHIGSEGMTKVLLQLQGLAPNLEQAKDA